MRDMRPDSEDPGFQQVRFDDQESSPPPGSTGGRVLAMLAVFAAPLVTIVAIFAFWPEDAGDPADAAPVEGEVAEADAADVAATDPVATLEAAQDRVAALEEEIDARKAELGRLRDEEDARRSEVEAQLGSLRADLSKAQAQRDDLRGRLRAALADLDREAGRVAEAQREVSSLRAANVENVWVAFTQSAKIEVCGQITARGREKCREKLDTWFDAGRHERFAACVDDSQTIPTLWKRPPTGTMPDYADALDLGPGKKNDWYVQFCNPTLPEATVAEATPAEPAVFMARR